MDSSFRLPDATRREKFIEERWEMQAVGVKWCLALPQVREC
jgi:hypothetical protein